MLFVCDSMFFSQAVDVVGSLMNFCRAGIMTVEAKSGRLSRSRNWEMCLASPMSSAAFFCSALYPLVSAFELAATLLGSLFR